jgi:hypothetical protein
VIEIGAGFRARFDEIAGRPAMAAGRFAGDRAAGGAMEHEIPAIGLPISVLDLTALDNGFLTGIWCD